MKTSQEVNEILPALAIVKAHLGKVVKGSSNPFFKSKYADLNTHLEAVEPVLAEYGLLLLQPVNNTQLGNTVESRIIHVKSGQFVSSEMNLVGETDMQKAGSAVTYARRYTLGSLLSLQAIDDDGEGTLTRGKKAASTTKTAPKKATESSWRKKKETKAEPVDTGLGDL